MKLSLSTLLFVLLLVFVSPQQSAAQISDSLFDEISYYEFEQPKNKDAVTHEEMANLIGRFNPYYVNKYSKEVDKLITGAANIFSTTTDLSVKLKCGIGLANFYTNINDYEKALFYYRTVAGYTSYTQTYNKEITKALASIGTILVTKNKYDSAVVMLHKALDLKINKDQDSAFLMEVYNCYELLYGKLALYERSIEYSRKFLSVIPHRDAAAIITMFQIVQNYNRLYKESQEQRYADSSEKILRELLVVTKETQDTWYAICYYLLGQKRYYSGEYKEAINLYDSCLQPKYISGV